MATPLSALDRWNARQCLLQLDPDVRALEPNAVRERVAEFLADWSESDSTCMYVFCSEWIREQNHNRCRTTGCAGDPINGSDCNGCCEDCADRDDRAIDTHVYYVSVGDDGHEVACRGGDFFCSDCEADGSQDGYLCSPDGAQRWHDSLAGL